ncbi:MAG: hypothetical protein ABI348_00755 [Nitrososphaera sp.]
MAHAKVGKAVPLALLAMLAGSIATIAGPAITTKAFAHTDKPVDFVTNIEYIRGHLEKVVENKNAGNGTLAVAHAGHPVSEVYTLIKADIQADDAALNTKLEGDLNALYAHIQNMTASDVQAKVADINASLDGAVAKVVGNDSNSTTLWAQVAMSLLNTSVEEYKEGVANGTVVQMVEYQDANAFMHRAEIIFGNFKPSMPAHEAEEATGLFTELHSLTDAKADAEQIETVISGINHEITEGFQLGGTVEDSEAVAFASNVEMIRGHMSQAIKNVQNNNYDLAQAHAGHPIAEHYALLKAEIAEHDQALDSSLESALKDLAANIKSMSAGQAMVQVAKVSRLLNMAISDVVTADTWKDSKFRAAVANSLLSTMQDEYAEAIQGGKITQMVEYQDAEAFTARANVLFRTFQAQLPAHEAEEAKEILANLKVGMKAGQEPAAINTLAQGAIQEIQKGAGIQAPAKELTSAEYIAKIRTLLGELKEQYAAGNNSRAESLAVEAYLDNFEHVEGPLVSAGQKDLMGEIEQLMRVQLRNMIGEKAPADQIDAHIATILDKLDQAEKALA